MLLLQPGIRRPRRKVRLRRRRRVVGNPAIDHGEIESGGEIVHEDAERVRFWSGGAGRRLSEGEEVGFEIDGADEEVERDEEEEEEEDGE